MEKTVPPTLFAPSPLPIDPTSVKPATAVLERSVQSVAPTQHTWLAGKYFLAVRYHTSITSGHRGSWRWRARPHYGWRYSVLGLDRGCFLFYFFFRVLVWFHMVGNWDSVQRTDNGLLSVHRWDRHWIPFILYESLYIMAVLIINKLRTGTYRGRCTVGIHVGIFCPKPLGIVLTITFRSDRSFF